MWSTIPIHVISIFNLCRYTSEEMQQTMTDGGMKVQRTGLMLTVCLTSRRLSAMNWERMTTGVDLEIYMSAEVGPGVSWGE